MNIILLSCIIIITIGLTASITNLINNKSSKKVEDLVVQFGTEVVEISKEAIDTYSIDPTAYDTAEAFRNALSKKVSDILVKNIKGRGEASDIIVNQNLLYIAIDYIFKLYSNELDIESIYNDAKLKKQAPEKIESPIIDEEIPGNIQAEFTETPAPKTVSELINNTVASTEEKVEDTEKIAIDLTKSESTQANIDKVVQQQNTVSIEKELNDLTSDK